MPHTYFAVHNIYSWRMLKICRLENVLSSTVGAWHITWPISVLSKTTRLNSTSAGGSNCYAHDLEWTMTFVTEQGFPATPASLRRPCTNVNRSTIEHRTASNNLHGCKSHCKSELLTAILATGVMYLEHEYMVTFYPQKLINYSKTTFLHQRPRAHSGSDAKVRTT